MNKLIEELQALIDKYKDGTPDGTSEEEAASDAERMSELTAEIERMSAEREEQSRARNAAVENARAAIERGAAPRIDSVPLSRSASGSGGVARDVTDYKAVFRRAWVKDVAARGGIQLVGGTELTAQERAAFTHLTSNTDAVVPVEVQNEIISLIDNSAVLFGDASRSTFKHQFELARHKAITEGDAAMVKEGAAPSDDEENEFDTLTLTGEEIKKTVKLSRKMAVQSIEGFESYLISELAARMAVAANAYVHAQLASSTVGIATANVISAATAGTLTKADLTKSFGLLKTFGNPTPKGCRVYANNYTIWNQIAMVEDETGRSLFFDEKSDDPAVQGRIFGRIIKQDDSCEDGVIKIGYPDLIKGNVFDGIDVTGYIATDGTQNHCFDGYLLYDCGLAVPEGFMQLTIGTAE